MEMYFENVTFVVGTRVQSVPIIFRYGSRPDHTPGHQPVNGKHGRFSNGTARFRKDWRAAGCRNGGFEAQSRVAVVGFATTALLVLGLTPIESSEDIQAAIGQLEIFGDKTNITAALQAAESCFRQGKSRRDSKEILLLTDGGHNLGDDPIPVAQRLKDAGCLIRTRGIGGNPSVVDENLLCEIASSGADDSRCMSSIQM